MADCHGDVMCAYHTSNVRLAIKQKHDKKIRRRSGKEKEERCEKQCLPDGHYALDIMTRLNEHYDLYNITEGENPLVKRSDQGAGGE